MALGFNVDFLKKTAGAGMAQGASVPQGNNTQNQQAVSNALAGGEKAKNNVDVTQMNTSELMKHVYNNQPEQSSQAETKENKKDVILPATVEYNDQKFSSVNKDLDKIVDEIVKKTGDSKTKVETELKRKYANPNAAKTGTHLNMSA